MRFGVGATLMARLLERTKNRAEILKQSQAVANIARFRPWAPRFAFLSAIA
jgi:hypothetical protein